MSTWRDLCVGTILLPVSLWNLFPTKLKKQGIKILTVSLWNLFPTELKKQGKKILQSETFKKYLGNKLSKHQTFLNWLFPK